MNSGLTMKDPIWKLFLDDVRDPPDESFVLARSVAEAQAMVLRYGAPIYISFDHDLGCDENGILLSDGYDFAKWLVAQDMDEHSAVNIDSVFDFGVHSMNPVGAENIRRYLQGYLDHKKREGKRIG